MSVRWVRNTKTGFVYDVPHDHWSLTDDNYEPASPPEGQEPMLPLEDITTLPESFPHSDILLSYGFVHPKDILSVTPERLQKLKGIGISRAKRIISAAEGLRDDST